MEHQEFYRARKETEAALKTQPADPEAQKLMAQILDREIDRQKATLEEKVIEEYSPEEKTDQVRTWLERGRMYLSLGHYDQAQWSAEQVFLFDASNIEASELIDDIQKKARAAGRSEELVSGQMLQTEVQDRLERYRQQARQAVSDKRWGEARLLVEKMLLLAPQDREALRLQKEIKESRP